MCFWASRLEGHAVVRPHAGRRALLRVRERREGGGRLERPEQHLSRQGQLALKDLKGLWAVAEIFADASETTEHLGQFIGLVLADSFEAARQGARLVSADYEGHDEQVVSSVEQAVRRGQVREKHGELRVGKAREGPKKLQGRGNRHSDVCI